MKTIGLIGLMPFFISSCVDKPLEAPRRPRPKLVENQPTRENSRLQDTLSLARRDVTTEPLAKDGPQVPTGFLTAAQARAANGRYINPNKEQVSGYTKQDGTQVGGYIRTQGNSTTRDNLRDR